MPATIVLFAHASTAVFEKRIMCERICGVLPAGFITVEKQDFFRVLEPARIVGYRNYTYFNDTCVRAAPLLKRTCARPVYGGQAVPDRQLQWWSPPTVTGIFDW